MGHVVAVVGLKREAAVLLGLDVVWVAGGGAPERLRHELAEAAQDADGIISFGMAGALDPALRIGDWAIGDRVGNLTTDPLWTAALARRLPEARVGPIHADGALVPEPARKAELNRTSGCLAADMESHIVAEVATQANLPFAVLRCVSDEAGAALPRAVGVAMKPDGGLALGAVLRSIAAEPGQLAALARTVRGFSSAYAALRSGAQRVGPRLAFDQR